MTKQDTEDDAILELNFSSTDSGLSMLDAENAVEAALKEAVEKLKSEARKATQSSDNQDEE